MSREDVTQMEPPELRQARRFRLRAAEHWLCGNRVFAYDNMLRAFDCLEAYVRDELIERAEKAEQQLHAAKSEADYWRKTVMAERGR